MGRATVYWLASAACAVALVGGPARAADLRINRPGEFTGRVNTAIDHGVEWLRSAQQAGGAFMDYPGYPGGVTALAYHTMRVCGVPKDDPAAVKAFDAMRQTYNAGKRRGDRDLKVYAAALYAMALAEHGEPGAAADRSGERLMTLSDEDATWMKELVKFLEETESERGRWSYPFPSRNIDAYDNSNTQYAILGLKAASRAGVKVRSSTWMKALKHFLGVQEDDGEQIPRFDPGSGDKGRTGAKILDRARGWDYGEGTFAYGSMTAGGVGSVVICRSELIGSRDYPPGLDAKAEQSARDGIAWLGHNFVVTTNPGPKNSMAGPNWLYYYLYAMERAGVLAGVEWMGEHDWYGEGAEFLLKRQNGNGAWMQSPMGFNRQLPAMVSDPYTTVTTCFALLFLKRGTAPVARGALTKSFDDGDINFGAAPALSDTDFDDFLDLVLSRWRRAASEDAKERIFARTAAVGPRIIAPLILRLDSTRDSERSAAFALLKRATGLDFGYNSAAKRDVREDSVAQWQSWWFASEKTARFDSASGRIVASN